MFRRSQPDRFSLIDGDARICITLMPSASAAQSGEWKSFFIAAAVECACFVALIGSIPGVMPPLPSREPKPQRKSISKILLFRPVPSAKQAFMGTVHTAARSAPAISEPSGVKLDMNTIRISVADDASNQLPDVLRQQGGMLALLETSDPSIAIYTFRPPDWRMEDDMVDISGKMRFSMRPASKWPLLRTIANSSGIEMERYEVDALFDARFAGCLAQEIRKSADASGRGQVQAVTLAFIADRSCGVDILDVQVK